MWIDIPTNPAYEIGKGNSPGTTNNLAQGFPQDRKKNQGDKRTNVAQGIRQLFDSRRNDSSSPRRVALGLADLISTHNS